MGRATRWLLFVVAAFLVLCLATGLVLRLELSHSGRQLLAAESYDAVFTLHGALGVFGFLDSGALALALLVARALLGAGGLAETRLVYACAGLAAAGVLATFSVAGGKSPAAMVAVQAGVLCNTVALALGAAALVVSAVRRGRPPGLAPLVALVGAVAAPVGLTAGMLGLAVNALARRGGAPGAELVPSFVSGLLVACLPVLVARVTARPLGPPHTTAVLVCLVALPPLPIGPLGTATFLFTRCLAGFFLVGRLIRAVLRWRARTTAAGLLLLLGVAPSLLVWTTLTAFVAALGPGVHLKDTYVAVASFHALAAALVFTLSVALCTLGEHAGLSVRPTPARIAAVVAGPATLVSLVLMARLGFRGLPRRYFNHLDSFDALNLAATIAGSVAVAGLLLLVASFRLRRARGG